MKGPLRVDCGQKDDPESGSRYSSLTRRCAAASVLRRKLCRTGLAALVDKSDDEDVVLAQVVDDAPREGGDLAQLRIVELRHLATDARRLGECVGFTADFVRGAWRSVGSL
jgi:hypothetical protein